MIDFEAIFQRYNIPTASHGRHKRQGYSNVVCPYCTGNPGHHLGFSHNYGNCVCFRCGGGKNVFDALSKVIGISYHEAQQLFQKHSTGYIQASFSGFEPNVTHVDIEGLNLRDLVPYHRQYLEQRGYNVERLIHFFGLKSTGVNTDPFYYKNKIFIPFYLNRKLMTYSTRDISVDTKQSGMRAKYVTCKKDSCLLPPNNFIYNFDNIKNRKHERTLFFEGAADTWNMPTCSGALSGVKFPPAQVKFIADNFKKPIFILDPDSAGDKGVEKAFDNIEVLTGVAPEVYELSESLTNEDGSRKDPGDLTVSEVDDLLESLNINK